MKNHVQLASDMDQVHALMAHYARSLWDLQASRVAMNNRLAGMIRDGITEPALLLPVEGALEYLTAAEKGLNKELRRLGKQHFMADWIEEQPGIGLPGFARILGATGSLDRFATPAKLWAYLGLHVIDGEAPRRKKGVKANFSQQGRVVAHQIGDSIVKAGKGTYREYYDYKRAEYLARERQGASGCPFGQVHKDRNGKALACVRPGPQGEISAHVHSAALRYAVKKLLRDMWAEWHQRANHAMKPNVELPSAAD